MKQNCEKLEVEIALVRRKLEKGTNLSRLENSWKIFDDILNSQRPSFNKVELGYDHKESNKDTKYEILKSDKNPKTYVATLQSSLKSENNQIKTDSNQHRRYQQLFLGYCFSCHKFGNKSLNCKSYRKNNHKSVQWYDHRNDKSSINQSRIK